MSNRFVPVVLLVLALALGGCGYGETPAGFFELLDALFQMGGLEVDPSGAGSGAPNPSGMAGGGAGPGG